MLERRIRLRRPARRRTSGIILAAGRGSRLGAETDDRPKCLVPVRGRPLLEHQLSVLDAFGIGDVCIVAGYRADQVRRVAGDRARVIYNPDWARTNSLYSFCLCRPAVPGGALVLNGDVLTHPAVIARLLSAPGSSFAYDSTSGHDDEHMSVELRGAHLRAMSKSLAPDRVAGENVGILHFDPRALDLLFQAAERTVARDGRRAWLAAAVEEIADVVPLRGVDVRDLPWIEIDFPSDLVRAERTWEAICSDAPEAPDVSQEPLRMVSES